MQSANLRLRKIAVFFYIYELTGGWNMKGDEAKIEDLRNQVNQNTLKITKLNSEIESDWKDNRELFEMIQGLQGEITELNQNINRYNGLIENRKEDRELLDSLHCRIDEIETEDRAKQEQIINWREWIGWIIATGFALTRFWELLT